MKILVFLKLTFMFYFSSNLNVNDNNINRYRRPVDEEREILLEPNVDDSIEIHNERLTLHKPTSQLVGDYYCRALKEDDKSSTNPSEFAVIKVRTQPYIEDFGLDTSHTGKSSIVTDGERLELICRVRDTSAPVNITWLRSMTPDDERTMVHLPDTPSSALPSQLQPAGSPSTADPFSQTFIAPDQSTIIESLGSHSKRLVIESVRPEHRSYYVCMVDNGITERTRKIIFIRVKDKLVALWPFLGIVAELFILFTIIHVWETQRAYKEIHATPPSAVAGSTGSKRPASGATVAFESVPLTSS